MGAPEGGITWLASYPKSGNTWVRMFLACYNNDGRPLNLNSVPREFTYTDNRSSDYHSISSYPIEHLGHTEIALMRGAVLVKLLSDTSIRPIFIKTHNAVVCLEDVNMIPRSITKNAVYIVRDPRDMVVSYSKYAEKSVDEIIEVVSDKASIIHGTDTIHSNIFQYIGSWSGHVKSWMNSSFDTLVIRYERMHEDPEYVFKQILEHVGWDVDEDRVRRTIDSVSFGKLRESEDENGFRERPPGVDKFFRNGKVGEWKDFLTKEQSDRIVADHGEVMKTLGYL